MLKFINRCKVLVVSGGTGPLILGSAAPGGFEGLADQGVGGGDQLRYAIEQNTEYEFGTCVMSLTGGVYTMTRTVLGSSSSNSTAINAGASAVCFFTMLAEDVTQYLGDLSNVSSVSPSGGHILAYNSTANSWEPQTPPGSATPVQTLADMQAINSPATGALCLVAANNNIYMYNGTGWFKIAMVNESPSQITGVNAAYTLESDGTPTIITAISTDPEGKTLSFSSSVTTGNLNGTTITQNNNVFTITPHASNPTSFTLTFSVTDGVNGIVSTISDFSLAFLVLNSRYTTFLAKASGSGTNQSFSDSSNLSHSVTSIGDSIASSFSPYRHSGYSLRFTDVASTDNNVLFDNSNNNAAGEFCVETWVKFTVTSPQAGSIRTRIFASKGVGGNSANNLQMIVEDGASTGSIAGTVSLHSDNFIYQASSAAEIINDGEFHHLAVTRDALNNLRWFVDGVLITTIAGNTTTFYFDKIRLGKRDRVDGLGQTNFTGEINQFRVVIGSSIYDSAFSPPETALTAVTNTFLLVGDDAIIRDKSINNHRIDALTFDNGSNVLLPAKVPISLFDNPAYAQALHSGSAFFDGSGDCVEVSNFVDLSTDSWTIEGWFWFDNFSTNQGLFCVGRDNGSLAAHMFATGGDLIVRVVDSGVGIVVDSVQKISTPKTWNHIAVTFSDSDNTVRIYVNGYLDSATGTKSSAWTFTESTLQVGSRFASGALHFPMTGHIADFRISKGSVRYTTDFDPPTTPLVSDSNTSFLLDPNFSVLDLSQSSNIRLFGNAAPSTTQIKFSNSKSIYLDGVGDYLQFDNSQSWISNYSRDWTIEFWFYPTNASTGAIQYLLTSGNGFRFYLESNGGLSLALDENNATSYFWHAQNVHTIVSNQWQHFAVVRSGSVYKIFVNGDTKDSDTSSNIVGTGTSDVRLGILNESLPAAGYFQDFRITKGLARYTSNFTPPTESLLG